MPPLPCSWTVTWYFLLKSSFHTKKFAQRNHHHHHRRRLFCVLPSHHLGKPAGKRAACKAVSFSEKSCHFTLRSDGLKIHQKRWNHTRGISMLQIMDAQQRAATNSLRLSENWQLWAATANRMLWITTDPEWEKRDIGKSLAAKCYFQPLQYWTPGYPSPPSTTGWTSGYHGMPTCILRKDATDSW